MVLAPEAVAELVNFLAYTGFSAKAYEEGPRRQQPEWKLSSEEPVP